MKYPYNAPLNVSLWWSFCSVDRTPLGQSIIYDVVNFLLLIVRPKYDWLLNALFHSQLDSATTPIASDSMMLNYFVTRLDYHVWPPSQVSYTIVKCDTLCNICIKITGIMWGSVRDSALPPWEKTRLHFRGAIRGSGLIATVAPLAYTGTNPFNKPTTKSVHSPNLATFTAEFLSPPKYPQYMVRGIYHQLLTYCWQSTSKNKHIYIALKG